jgi:hypothetical protein
VCLKPSSRRHDTCDGGFVFNLGLPLELLEGYLVKNEVTALLCPPVMNGKGESKAIK